jgi:PAS domain S-box-containing protein
MKTEVPRSFRRESRLFLSVALLLILFLNFLTLLFFRNGVEWGSEQAEWRAGQILRRVSLAAGDPADSMEKAVIEPDVSFIAFYDGRGHRVRTFSRELAAPAVLPTERPAPGHIRSEWKREPPLLVAALAAPNGFFVVALEAGTGSTLRSYARSLTVFVPLAGAILVVLAWLYLRSILRPFERLLEAAEAAPSSAAGRQAESADERDFVIARFEATTAALSEKERELARLARVEKERADDMEIAARTLARHLPTGLLSVDSEGSIVELNEAGREILGISTDTRGEPFRNVLAPVPELRSLVEGVLRGGPAVGRQEVSWRRGHEDRVLGVTVTPATGADGRFLGVLGLFTDLSQVKLLEARVALARHLADLGEVSAGAAHEFRNAAAAIDGFADLALRHPERAAEHLKAIRQEAQEISRVTSDFLLFARPEGFVPERVDLAGVTEAASVETESVFRDVAVARSGEFAPVSGSPVLLRRALVNLLHNAAEATPEGRRREADAITLSGEKRDREITVTVGDRGPGVDPSQREKIFLPFYSTKPNGVGFGLAIVARIVELHGGTVEVTERPGGGALFTLRLSSAAPLPADAAPFLSGGTPMSSAGGPGSSV